jgi:uncharacterized protein involved in exopolysaccharide biosynthesis
MQAKKPAQSAKQHSGGKAYPRPLDESVYESSPKIDATEVNLVDVFRVFARYHLLIIGMILLATLTTTATAFLLTPQYRADILVQPVSDADERDQYSGLLGQLGGIASLTGIKMDAQDNKYKSIATLRSRQFTERFIEQEKLLPVLFADIWDQDSQSWRVDDNNEVPTQLDAYELFNKKIRRVSEDRMTGLVTLSISWSDPELAANWANRMIQAVNAALRQRVFEDSNKAIEYLQAQLKQTSVVELQDVLHRLIESEMKEAMLANINEEYAFRVIDPAVVPEDPSSPKIASLVVLGVVIGVLLGLFAALVLNYLRERRANLKEVELCS